MTLTLWKKIAGHEDGIAGLPLCLSGYDRKWHYLKIVIMISNIAQSTYLYI